VPELEVRESEARRRLEDVLTPEVPMFDRLQRRRRARRRSAAVVGLSVVVSLVLLASALVERGPSDESLVTTPGDTPTNVNADLLEPGASRPIADSPLAGRSGAASAWTGSEVLVWGGAGAGDLQYGDGAAFDPREDAWRSLPESPLTPRSGASSVWTGEEWVVWGGVEVHVRPDGFATAETLTDGAAYDPVRDRWRSIADPPSPSARAGAVWTGEEVVAVGGSDSTPQAAAYDPVADEWRVLPGVPGVIATWSELVWTGEQVVGLLQVRQRQITVPPEPVAYDPTSDEWEVLPPLGIWPGQVAWTGDELLVVPESLDEPTAAAAVGDPWRQAAAAIEEEVGSVGTVPVWTGDQLVLFTGGFDGPQSLPALAPASGRWAEVPRPDGLRRVDDGVVEWADGVLVVWGGLVGDGTGSSSSTGLLYRPPSPEPTGAADPAGSLPPPTTVPPMIVGVSGPEGTVPGSVDQNGRWARWGGQTLPLLEVHDDTGALAGYFGECGFLPPDLVQVENFDLDAACRRNGTPVSSTALFVP
jgi:hypothetical protein